MSDSDLPPSSVVANPDTRTGDIADSIGNRNRSFASTIAFVNSLINFWVRYELKQRTDVLLTYSQVTVLYHVRLGVTTSSEIAFSLSLTRRAITTTVDQLVALGLIERRDDPADRRINRLSITDEGVRLSYALEEQLLTDLVRLLDDLTQDERVAVERGVDILLSVALRLPPHRHFTR